MELTARLFNCGRCHQLVFVCSCCDRGQIYCPGSCSLDARQETFQRASARYQLTRLGRRNHARRQAAYRLRLLSPRQKVTHQGSPKLALDVTAPPTSQPPVLPQEVQAKEEQSAQENQITTTQEMAAGTTSTTHRGTTTELVRCSLCYRACEAFLRRGFIRRRRGPLVQKRSPRQPVLRKAIF